MCERHGRPTRLPSPRRAKRSVPRERRARNHVRPIATLNAGCVFRRPEPAPARARPRAEQHEATDTKAERRREEKESRGRAPLDVAAPRAHIRQTRHQRGDEHLGRVMNAAGRRLRWQAPRQTGVRRTWPELQQSPCPLPALRIFRQFVAYLRTSGPVPDDFGLVPTPPRAAAATLHLRQATLN